YLQADMLIFIIVLCIVALATKILGCGLPAKLMGMNWKESMMIGVGMTPRGEVAMIVGLIALNHFKDLAVATTDPARSAELLALGNELFIAIVVVSLVTTIIVPLIFNGIFFRKERKEALACAAEIKTHT
ncbi:MAG TPA: cation:proton antiporter, partial [Methanocorpusculum sp.]|nr:cation:proton antiporter [Methanocorpusculum sp.]